MKKSLSIFFLVIVLIQLIFIPATLAAELSNGAKIFSSNCASCHIAGGNILISEKTLKKEALQKYLEDYEINSIQSILDQVTNGKGAMPAFKGKLNEQELLEVAGYVFQKAEQGW